MKKFIILLVLALVGTLIIAAPKSQQEILNTAQNWLEAEKNASLLIASFSTLNDTTGVPLIYLVDFSPDGFVIMSADDRVYPILGYSNQGSITNNSIEALDELLQYYTERVSFIVASNFNNDLTQTAWSTVQNHLLSGSLDPVIITLEDTWSQWAPYNSLCPILSNVRTPVGCGATAMAQILNYHKYWNHHFNHSNDHYAFQYYSRTINIDDYHVEGQFPTFDELNQSLSEIEAKYENDETLSDSDKATLSFACGILLHMKYATDASGTDMMTNGASAYTNANYHYITAIKSSYTEQQWESLIVNEIDAGRPIQYSGHFNNNGGGHSFVVHGYRDATPNSREFWINWGWGGTSDGFFSLSNLNPYYTNNVQQNFTIDQNMIYGIMPPGRIYQKVCFQQDGIILGSQSDLTLYNVDNGSSQTYTSNANGLFIIPTPEYGSYDVVIKNSANIDDYEWYQILDVQINANTTCFEPTPIILNFNCDKSINIPNDYSSIQEALCRIQNNGIVIVHGNTTNTPYDCNGLAWKHKHVTLISSTSPNRAILRGNGDKAIYLDGTSINNLDRIKNFKFQGGTTNLHGAAITLTNGAAPIVENCQFINNSLQWLNQYNDPPLEQAMGGAVYIEGVSASNMSPQFRNCLFQGNNCFDGKGGGALGLAGPASFENCIFDSNICYENNYSSFPSRPSAAIAYINSALPGEISFINCDFKHSFSQDGANEIDIDGANFLGNIIIRECRFEGLPIEIPMPHSLSPSTPAIQVLHNNLADPPPPGATFCFTDNRFTNYRNSGILVNDYEGRMELNISHNVFDLEAPYGVQLNYLGQTINNANYFTFDNNTMLNRIDTDLILHHGAHYIINNCIFQEWVYYAIQWGASDSQQQRTKSVTINNCIFSQATNHVDYTGDDTNVLSEDNLYFAIDHQVDDNYIPIWNETSKSLCIDNGNIDTSSDIDGTPADIGARPARTHAYWEYTFRKTDQVTPNERSDTWHWVCYPIIDSRLAGAMVANVFFEELLGTHTDENSGYNAPDVLQEILWKIDNEELRILWENNVNHQWSGSVNSHVVTSAQGYKIKLLSTEGVSQQNAPDVILHESGFQTPPSSDIPIYGSNSSEELYENWLGYYDTECSWPQDAFSSIWDDIIMLKTKNWCLYRSGTNDEFSALSSPMYPLKCGDMVIVATHNDHPTFKWNVDNPTDPITKPQPKYFSYEEKPDYVPVMITLNGIDKMDLKEVGLKLNGEFKGAVVIENDIEQLCAYLGIDEKLTDGNIELIFYYQSSKNQQQVMKNVSLSKAMLSTDCIAGNPDYPVYNITVSGIDFENLVAPVLALEQNCPNPFNPSTRITYSLKDAGKVSLDIYNAKGQLVKTLYQGNSGKGNFSVTWDGKDNMGIPCSSGIYLYTLRSQEKTLARKMMLMK